MPDAWMMRIGIDAGPALTSQGGIGQYVRGLIRAFGELAPPHEFRLSIPQGVAPPLTPPFPNGTASWVVRPRWRWSNWWHGDRVEIYHGTNFKLHARGTLGTVLTIHDLWLCRYPQYSKKLGGERWALARLKRRVWSAQRIIAVSQATARDLQELIDLPSERIRVVYHGAPTGFYPDRDEKAWLQTRQALGLPNRPFVLFVGGADPRKNHQLVFRALSRMPGVVNEYALVLVGSRAARGMDLLETAKHVGLRSGIYPVGSVSPDTLRRLYSRATVFLFPSIYEGFGFPVLEAMACGTPVITSKTTALPEVAGDAALLIDPQNDTECLTALTRLLDDEALRRSLIAKGFEQAGRFTWKRAAEQTIALYEELGSRNGKR